MFRPRRVISASLRRSFPHRAWSTGMQGGTQIINSIGPPEPCRRPLPDGEPSWLLTPRRRCRADDEDRPVFVDRLYEPQARVRPTQRGIGRSATGSERHAISSLRSRTGQTYSNNLSMGSRGKSHRIVCKT